MDTCLQCQKRFYSAVKFCPYCGVRVGVPNTASILDADKTSVAAHPPSAASTRQDNHGAPAQKVAPAPAPVVMPPVAAPTTAAIAPALSVIKNIPKPHRSPGEATGVSRARETKPAASGWKLLLAVAAAIVAASLYFVVKPGKNEQSCEDAVDQGIKFVAAGDLAKAKSSQLLASASCVGSLRVKMNALQTALTDAENAGKACRRAISEIEGLLADHRLASAGRGLTQLDGTCAATDAANRFGQQLTQAKADAEGARAAAREAIENGDTMAARHAIDKLEHSDRESTELPKLREDAAGIAPKPSPQIAPQVSKATSGAVTPPVQEVVSPSPKATTTAPPVQVSQPRTSDSAPPAPQDQTSALYAAAIGAMRHGQYDHALDLADQALTLAPNDTKIQDLKNTIVRSKQQVSGH